ncbi:MAG: Ig-like domain-containing protein, partial [Chloroflexi bacterium]|nr:Ig-like domain-containing protein [Chloroflexota bacterium]
MQRLPRFVLAALSASLVLSSCLPGSRPAPAPEPIELVFPRPESADVPVFGPIALRVRNLAEREALERSFALDPPAPGAFDWEDDTLVFRPDWPGLAPGASYEVRWTEGGGAAEPQRARFTTAGRLAVASVVPEQGAADVAVDASLYVQFNRPVVPLTALDQSTRADQFLRFDPPLAGAGRWLNTSLYTFKPTDGWRPSTAYRVAVPASVSDVRGGTLGAEVAWTFTTAAPAVAATDPKPNETLVGPGAAIKVRFNQPVDRAAVQARFTLALAGGAPVAGAFEWPDDRTLLFRPAQPLAPDTRYEGRLAAGLPSTPGGGTGGSPVPTGQRPVPPMVSGSPVPTGQRPVPPMVSGSPVPTG